MSAQDENDAIAEGFGLMVVLAVLVILIFAAALVVIL